MEPLSYISIVVTSLWIANFWDYVAFSNKHRETQQEIKNLRGDIAELTSYVKSSNSYK